MSTTHLSRRFARPTALVAAALLALGAGSAAADPVVFSFDGADQAAAASYSESSTDGLYGLLVTAYRSVGGGAFTEAGVRRMGDALGVTGSGPDSNPAQVDNSANNVEALLFDFGSAGFASLQIAFSLLAANESMDLWYGNSLDLLSATSPLENHLANPAVAGSAPADPFDLAGFGGRYLLIAAANNGQSPLICGPANGNSCFRVDGISATVPEPGTLALGSLALAAALGLRRRRGAPG